MKKLHKNRYMRNHMQVAVILTMLCALVHATTAEGVPVEIELVKEKDTPRLKRTFDTVDFGCMEVFNVLDEKKRKLDTEPPEVPLGMISDEDMLARLKRYWNSDMTDSDQDIDADTFYRFIRASDYLLLQGDKYKRFVKNVVRKGVLGKHSMAIVRQPLDEYYMGCLQRMAGQMLIALASRYGCEVRVVKRDDHKTDVTLCYVRHWEAESYGDICSVFETSPVIDKLSVRCNILSDRVDRMEILTWLTDHLEVALLWIGPELGMTEEDTQSIMKWRSETRLGLSLDIGGYRQPSYSFVEAHIPTIPALEELHIQGVAFEPSAAHIFGQCEKLEKLCLTEAWQDSSFVSALIPNITSIRELTICAGELSTDAAEAFRQCERLEKLDLGRHGSVQTSSFVSALMANIPSIRELTVSVEELSAGDAMAFRQCEKLEKLCIDGSEQDSSFVSALMPNLPNIRELTIRVEDLSPGDTEAFGQCKGLEKLEIVGYRQTSSFVSALMSNLTNIRELTVSVGVLSTDTAMVFRQCERLEKVVLFGSRQTSSFVSALMPNLTSIRELTICAGELSTDASMAFGQCKRLEKLDVFGSKQTSSFVSALVSNLPVSKLRELKIRVGMLSSDTAMAFREFKELEKLCLDGLDSRQDSSFVSALMSSLPGIRELTIGVKELSPGDVMVFRQCKRLEKLYLTGLQTSSFVSALMSSLTNIRELTIEVEELRLDDAVAFRQCKRLEKLYLIGNIEPGCVEHILSSPYMESLRYLYASRVMGGLSDGDGKAIDEACRPALGVLASV